MLVQSIAQYEATSPWSLFNEIVAEDYHDSGIDSVTSGDTPVDWYNLNGVRISGEAMPAGIYLRRQGSKVKKVAVH